MYLTIHAYQKRILGEEKKCNCMSRIRRIGRWKVRPLFKKVAPSPIGPVEYDRIHNLFKIII